jgi:DNA topoisomerase-1
MFRFEISALLRDDFRGAIESRIVGSVWRRLASSRVRREDCCFRKARCRIIAAPALDNYDKRPARSDGENPARSAHDAHLRYVSDCQPGITRERRGGGFVYRYPGGAAITDREELGRIKRIAVPPAWTDVWICPYENGHIQATGRDARGRKQYRYHPRWRGVRDETKFEHILNFGRALPAIRRRIEADLAKPGLPREKVLAAVVRLMERTLARVGNPEYARQNDSFGLTTLRNRHVRIAGGKIELDFRAKHGIRHHSVVSDRKLARILKNCRDLPGSELFQYIDDDGERHAIDSGDVNEYLRAISGQEITAKDFRTWAGTNLAVLALVSLGENKPTKRGLARAVKQVAEQLGNTPAVCRASYIHPALMDAYLEGALDLNPPAVEGEEHPPEMWQLERQVLRFLDRRLAAAPPRSTLKKALRASIKAMRSKRGIRTARRNDREVP